MFGRLMLGVNVIRWRTILPLLTALAVCVNALVCMCGPEHSASRAGHPQAAATAGCHGHVADADTPAQPSDGHSHGGGCDCHGASFAPDAKPAQPTLAAADAPGPWFVALPPWHAHASVLEAPRLRQARLTDAQPPGDGETLLRLHCTLIL